MTDRPKDFVDYDDEDEVFIGAPPAGAIDYDDEEESEVAELEAEETEESAEAEDGDEQPVEYEEEPELERAPAPRAERFRGAPRGAEVAPPDEDPEDYDARVREGVGRAAAVLKYIVEQIVDEPQEIAIGAATDDRGPVLLLRVAEDDRGKIIGRQGRIVQAIRTIVKAATVGTGEKVGVEVVD